jgi:Ni/Fe-hydrogenase subunit HybB-like protein
MSQHQPVGGRVLTPVTVVLGLLVLIALWILAQRFAFGLGAVTNLNNGYPWGIWVVYDIVIGTAFGCGGLALALTVYIMNKGQYHPLVRPAVLASLFGYALGGFSAFFDMGRYWNFYNIFIPSNMNLNSVMLEVGLCVFAYVLILAIEAAPPVLEKFGMKNMLARLNKVLFLVIALGVLLPFMHQSSLGSLLISAGGKVHPLWQANEMLPLLALLSAIAMGFSIVIFEASLSALGLKHPMDKPLLAGMAPIIVGLLGAFLAVRFGQLLLSGEFGAIFTSGTLSLAFLIETALFVFPMVVLLNPANRTRAKLLFVAALALLLAGAVWRMNAFLIGFQPGPGYSYFPSTQELLVTIGLVAFEVVAFIVIVKIFPIFKGHSHQAA